MSFNSRTTGVSVCYCPLSDVRLLLKDIGHPYAPLVAQEIDRRKLGEGEKSGAIDFTRGWFIDESARWGSSDKASPEVDRSRAAVTSENNFHSMVVSLSF